MGLFSGAVRALSLTLNLLCYSQAPEVTFIDHVLDNAARYQLYHAIGVGLQLPHVRFYSVHRCVDVCWASGLCCMYARLPGHYWAMWA